jgi:thiamine biosynthesis lipoprotein
MFENDSQSRSPSRSATLLALACICLASNGLAKCVDVERTQLVMGTLLRIQACAPTRATSVAAIEASFAQVQHLDDVLSSWRPNSEIGGLNAAPAGARLKVSAELGGLLQEVDRWVRATGFALDPAIGALIDVWGFRATPHVPSAQELAHALAATGWSQLSNIDSTTIIRGPAHWWIDTGAFGKGAAVDAIARVLREHGVQQANVDFGGQVLALGSAVVVGVADPRRRSVPVTFLRIRNLSLSTSSQSERFIEANGNRYGHILDPRTGMPVEPWGSVTVASGNALAADALSTALFVMGPVRAVAWAQQHPDIGVLIQESLPDGKVSAHWNRAMQPWIQEKKS